MRAVKWMLAVILGLALGMGGVPTATAYAADPPASPPKAGHAAHIKPNALPAPAPRAIGPRVDTSLTYIVTTNADTAPSAADATCTPVPATTANCATLRQAINAASASDPGTGVNTIIFAVGVTGAIVLNQTYGTLNVTAFPLTITGPGQAALALDGGCTAGCGTATPTGGVRVLQTDTITQPALTLTDLTIRNGKAVYNGAAYITGAGGGILSNGPLALTNVTFTGNSALGNGSTNYGYGGGLYTNGSTTLPQTLLTNVTATGNYANNSGGGINIESAATLLDVTVTGNNSGGYMGGIEIDRPTTATNLTVTNNTAVKSAGGVEIDDKTTITGLVVTGNTAGTYSGGIEIDDTTTITGLVVTNNHATLYDGGGILTYYLLTLTHATISGNTAGRDGGGVFNDDDSIFTDVTISGNTAVRDGGGYYGDNYQRNSRLFTGLTISGNTAGRDGGGFFDQNHTTVVNGTIAHNTATDDGGGIYIESTPATNSYIGGPALFTLDASTVSDNTANLGGGVALGTVGGTPTTARLNDTLVAGNHLGGTTPVGPDLYSLAGDTFTGTYNFIGDGTGQGGTVLANGANNNRVGTAATPLLPLLAPLGTYGATNGSQTFALLPGSPAIDTGTCPTYTYQALQVAKGAATITATVTTDARGIARPQGGVCDVGSFESRGFTLTTPTGGGSTAITRPFAAPLGVTLTPGDPGVPVDGGTITFTLTPGTATATFAATGGSGAGCTVSNGGLTAACPISGGIASTPTLTAGTTAGTLTASATTLGVSTPAAFTLTVTQASTATGVTTSPNPSTAGTSVTLTATVTSVVTGVPLTGTVTFTSGATNLGTGTVNATGVATVSTTALPAGANQTITATYNGDANFTGSIGTTTQTVTALTLNAPTGSGSGNSGTTTNVIIRPNAPLQLVVTGAPGGSTFTYQSSNGQQVDVSATGLVTGIAATSTPVTITVTGPNGATATITVTVTAAGGSGLTNPIPQPMAHATVAPVSAAPLAQPSRAPSGGSGGVQPQAAGATAMPQAPPQVQPNRR